MRCFRKVIQNWFSPTIDIHFISKQLETHYAS